MVHFTEPLVEVTLGNFGTSPPTAVIESFPVSLVAGIYVAGVLGFLATLYFLKKGPVRKPVFSSMEKREM